MPNEQTIKIVTFLFLIQVILKMDLFNYTWMHCYGKQTHPVCKYKNIQMRWDYNENNLLI